MKPAPSEVCGSCFEGEIGFGPDADLCPVCEGSGFVARQVPRFIADTRAEKDGLK